MKIKDMLKLGKSKVNEISAATGKIAHDVGEIDIIARRGQLLVFCEVKFRQKDIHLASPSPYQQKRITRAASLFISTSAHYQNCECRFDVILIERKPYALWSRLIPIINAW